MHNHNVAEKKRHKGGSKITADALKILLKIPKQKQRKRFARFMHNQHLTQNVFLGFKKSLRRKRERIIQQIKFIIAPVVRLTNLPFKRALMNVNSISKHSFTHPSAVEGIYTSTLCHLSLWDSRMWKDFTNFTTKPAEVPTIKLAKSFFIVKWMLSIAIKLISNPHWLFECRSIVGFAMIHENESLFLEVPEERSAHISNEICFISPLLLLLSNKRGEEYP